MAKEHGFSAAQQDLIWQLLVNALHTQESRFCEELSTYVPIDNDRNELLHKTINTLQQLRGRPSTLRG
jgi:hypothetical protein